MDLWPEGPSQTGRELGAVFDEANVPPFAILRVPDDVPIAQRRVWIDQHRPPARILFVMAREERTGE